MRGERGVIDRIDGALLGGVGVRSGVLVQKRPTKGGVGEVDRELAPVPGRAGESGTGTSTPNALGTCVPSACNCVSIS